MTSIAFPQDDRFAALTAWVAEVLGADAPVPEPLHADASFRRYYRLQGLLQPLVVMDAPPEKESLEAFARIDAYLRTLKLSAPEIRAMDTEQGFALLEDLGNHRFSRALNAGADPEALYRLATDTLVALQQRWPTLAAQEIAPYDEAVLLQEALLLLDWYWPEAWQSPCPDEVRQAYIQAWQEVLPAVFTLPQTLVLRDYHVDNLMVLAGRSGISACGLLDFQDALLGNPAYDLVSLLRDARRDVPPELADAMKGRFYEALVDENPQAWEDSYWILGAQRNSKIIGIFTRLWRRDHKPAYLSHLPRVWRLLDEELQQPALAPVRAWFEQYLPLQRRLALAERAEEELLASSARAEPEASAPSEPRT
ncbi:hypothetical protein SAMN05216526_0878 [Ectothiorhodosinus mongolicus]|uniref:Aminoglycoside phosphotransferase domain-containing protein n=1 Tax=Ectothiorhodosinus mongolicus TaxID=233100 RepID=A0A1R3VUA6_9GAMM|nr:phosphotransferase [Ectothiorhodosinus mongolicus]ULX57910.1 aminoglycoside phosphotransferase [Ectothiorhodosinus mongolicus]SIT68545.1 hypothetical protein SAMN05216526_0878 [Ectothiorhodosinus mongolicus]